MNDTRLLRSSIENYAAGFLQDWNTNIHRFKSLPGIAEAIAYKFYNPESPAIYSFGQKFAKYNKEIRDQLHGGMTMVFHRMIDLGKCIWRWILDAFVDIFFFLRKA